MRLVRILEEASEEATEAASWYDAERLGLGSEFFEALEAALDLIEEDVLPLLPIPGKAGARARRIILKRFPYDVVAVEMAHETIVIAIAHHSRRPGFWRDRLKNL